MAGTIMHNLYKWSGISENGEMINGRSYAESKINLKYTLYKQQIIAKKIQLQNRYCLKLRRWSNCKQTLFFLTQLHALLKIGLNLSKTVDILQQNQSDSQLSELSTSLKYQLSRGEKLSTILRLYPTLFDSIIIQLVNSGEVSGQLDKAIHRAIHYYDQNRKTLNQLLTALLYPAILFLVSIAVLTTLIIFVIPQFESIYAQAKAELPFITLVILNISNGLIHNFKIFCLVIILISIMLIILGQFKQYPWTDYIPIVNHTIKKIHILRFCQTVSWLYAAGLTIVDCIESCRNLSSNSNYQRALNKMLTEIQRGRGLADALSSSQYFDDLTIQLIRTGEESASLTLMLDQCTHYYSEQLNNNFDRLKIILEPVLIVGLGAMIGIILIAMYLPVFNMGSSF